MPKTLFALPLIALSLATSLATPALADDSTRADLLMQLIRDNGCQMTNAEAGEMLPSHGFTMAETRDIVAVWQDQGLLDAKGFAGLKLSEAACSDS